MTGPAPTPISSTLQALLDCIRQAQTLGAELGLKNILQPGLLKELVIAEVLGHRVISSKHQADACDPSNPSQLFEYLSCTTGGSFQMDRVFSRPADKRERSLDRIERNAAVYCAVFDPAQPLQLLELYEVAVPDLLAEAVRQLDTSSNDISHLSFSRRWVRANGRTIPVPVPTCFDSG